MELTSLKIIGMGGHARSLISNFHNKSIIVTGYYDDNGSKKESLTDNISFDGKFNDIPWNNKMVLGIGSNTLRKYFFNKLQFPPQALIHKNLKTHINSSGVQIFDKVYIGPESFVGVNTIINTGSIIEHNVRVGNHSHISIGAILSGNVEVGDNCFIGAGATIIDKIKVHNNIIVGAGSVVVKDLLKEGTYIGNPAKLIKK